ncbi:MAG: DUF892 family protein [Pacificimonas sp.]
MSTDTLKDLYVHELRDIISANKQMRDAMPAMVAKADDAKLKEQLQGTHDNIPNNNQKVTAILERHGADAGNHHCRAMEGLVAEATKHAVEAEFGDPDARDVALLAQYQKLTHYGITGFGTAKAYATALGDNEAAETLGKLTHDMYQADEQMSQLAERSVNLAAKG